MILIRMDLIITKVKSSFQCHAVSNRTLTKL